MIKKRNNSIKRKLIMLIIQAFKEHEENVYQYFNHNVPQEEDEVNMLIKSKQLREQIVNIINKVMK